MSLKDILKQKYDEHIVKYGEEGHTNSLKISRLMQIMIAL